MTTFAAADGTSLALHRAGAGPLLACVPGGPMQAAAYLGDLGGLPDHRELALLDLRGTGDSARPADPTSYRYDRQIAGGEPWYPAAAAALARIQSGAADPDDWAAISPFTYGRWDEAARAHAAAGGAQRNADAAAVYYGPGTPDPAVLRGALRAFDAPVLLVTGEHDVALPPVVAAEFAALFARAELVVQPGAGHFPWLDDPDRFVRAVAAFLG